MRIELALVGKLEHVDLAGGELALGRLRRPIVYFVERVEHTRADPRQRIVRRHILPRTAQRSEEHTSELQSLMRLSYAVFCLKKKKYIKPSGISQQIHQPSLYRT